MSEEQVQQAMNQVQTLETHFAEVTQQEESIVRSYKEAIATAESIRSLMQNPESDVLIPMGVGTFISTKVSSSAKMVQNIGGGAVVEKDMGSILNYIESHIKSVEIALQNTSAKRQEIAMRLEQSRTLANRLIQSMNSITQG